MQGWHAKKYANNPRAITYTYTKVPWHLELLVRIQVNILWVPSISAVRIFFEYSSFTPLLPRGTALAVCVNVCIIHSGTGNHTRPQHIILFFFFPLFYSSIPHIILYNSCNYSFLSELCHARTQLILYSAKFSRIFIEIFS